MRYHHLEGATQTRPSYRRWIIGIPAVLLGVGIYMLVNMNAPLLQGIDGRAAQATAQKLLRVKPGSEGDRLYIPQINVDVSIMEGDDAAALENGAWHRRQTQGDPETGGTFVLGARSLSVGMTPAQTKARSPFYHLDKLEIGDEIFVDWKGKRHVYEVKKRVMADGLDTLLQSAGESDSPTLTLYVADDKGEVKDEVALRAEKVGVVAWGQKPVIQRDANAN